MKDLLTPQEGPQWNEVSYEFIGNDTWEIIVKSDFGAKLHTFEINCPEDAGEEMLDDNARELWLDELENDFQIDELKIELFTRSPAHY